MKLAEKGAQKSAKSTATSKKFKGFTEEEHGAMKERIQELGRTRLTGKAPCSRSSLRCVNRIAPWASGCMLLSKKARQPSRRDSGTGCQRMPRPARTAR